MGGPCFTFKRTTDVGRAHTFHFQNLTPYLRPRDKAAFRALVDDRALYEAEAPDGSLAGICYMVKDAESNQYEFGGVFVLSAYRGMGVADALARIAITSELLRGGFEEGTKLIAHVHEMNEDPLKLLRRLGFEQVGTDPLPPHLHPKPTKVVRPDGTRVEVEMARNTAGEIVGRLFHFEFKTCELFAEWFDRCRTAGVVRLEAPVEAEGNIELAFYNESYSDSMDSLLAIADGKTQRTASPRKTSPPLALPSPPTSPLGSNEPERSDTTE